MPSQYAGPTGLQGEWQIGKARVRKFVEMQDIMAADNMDMAPSPTNKFSLLPGATPEVVKSVGWLSPHFATPNGELLMSIHMLVIDTPGGARVAVDTCVGNQKQRALSKAFTMRDGPFIQEIEAAGCTRDSFTHVVATHMHVDHVGFNTMLVNDKWVPTFPKAKYVFAKKEYEHFQTNVRQYEETKKRRWQMDHQIQQDSITPVVEAGLSDLVDTDATLVNEPDVKISLVPTHGHTPGHVSVLIQSAGEEALITGDCTHHPIQMALHDIDAPVDSDQATTRQTRASLWERLAVTNPNCRIIGTHFATPSSGFVRRDGSAFKLVLDGQPGAPPSKL